MSDTPQTQPPGWYYAQGDPPETQRYWDGTQWQGGPQPVPGAGQGAPGQMGVGAMQDNLADAGKRIGARLIDVIIWIVVGAIFAVAIGGGSSSIGTTEFSGRSWIAGVVSTLVIAAYEVFMVANKGGTLGKLALGMKVVKEDGSPADMNSALMRIVTYVIGIVPVVGGFITFIVGLVSLVFLFSDKRRQAVWDKIAKTIVVNA